MLMHKEQLPPVPIIQEYIPEFYAVTTDIFHVYHLYFTEKVNSKKKSLGFVF